MAKAQTTNGNGKVSAPSQEELAAQIDQIKTDVGQLTRMLADYAGQTEAQAKERLKASAAAMKDYGEVAIEKAKQQASLTHKQANDFVAEKPGLALGIAAGLGFLVGAWGARR